MNKDFETAFVLLKDALCRAVIKDHEEIFVWRNYLQDIPFCEVADVSGEEILRGSLFKGYIHLWQAYPLLDYDFDEEEYDELCPSDPNVEAKRCFTAKFYFKENNKAKFVYPLHDNLPDRIGTWKEIFLEIIDFVRRKSCEDPSFISDLGEQMRQFQYSQDN